MSVSICFAVYFVHLMNSKGFMTSKNFEVEFTTWIQTGFSLNVKNLAYFYQLGLATAFPIQNKPVFWQ